MNYKKPHRIKRRRKWTKIDEIIFTRFYPDYHNAALAHYFKRSVGSISTKASLIGLKKSDRFIDEQKRLFLENSKKYRFEKGNIPPNKGKSQPVTGRMAETQFKKGHKPHGWKPVGSERLTKEGYLQRKMSDTGYPPSDWVNVHHLIWIEHNGPIPKGFIVVFKDGNRTNLCIENLELISWKENMKRNSLHTNYPPELRKVIHLRGCLNRKINRLEKRHEK